MLMVLLIRAVKTFIKKNSKEILEKHFCIAINEIISKLHEKALNFCRC